MRLPIKHTYKLLLAGFALTAILGGCKKSYFDINDNPNQAVDASIEAYAVLPGALQSTASQTGTGYAFLMRWMGFMATSSGVAPSVEEESYNVTSNFGTASFSTMMDINYDFQVIENKAKEKDQKFYVGVAKIMKAYNFGRIVDVYGDIPYTEALQGLKYITPKYDDGKAVYEDLIKQIDTGMTLIKGYDAGANPNAKTSDIMFGGVVADWLKFANTLKLRLLIHQSNRADRQAYIQTEMAKIVAEGSGFLATGKTAAVNPGYSQSQPNSFYAGYGFTTAGQDPTQSRANANMIDFLKADKDPRITAIYKPIASALPAGAAEPYPTLEPKNYRGNYYGLPVDNATYKNQTANFLSRVGGITAAAASSANNAGLVKGWDQRAWVMTSIESLFLQAEAINKGYLAGTLETAYKNAVQESFIFLNVGAGTIDTAKKRFNDWYTIGTGVANIDFAAAPDKGKLIAYQKYIALAGIDALEQWTDYRRNGAYPVIALSQNPGRTSPKLPVRLLYPQAELNYNIVNVPAKGRKAGEQFTENIWWMP
jgi:Starch-binding associating with outer membrane